MDDASHHSLNHSIGLWIGEEEEDQCAIEAVFGLEEDAVSHELSADFIVARKGWHVC